MAVTLPTLTVTDAQGARILAAFKAKFGTTTAAETALAYRRWLARQCREAVLAYEASKLDEANNATKRAALATMEAGLPDPETVT